jgi:voltage-gated potassium channel Kch
VVPFFNSQDGLYNGIVFLLIAMIYGWAAFKIITQLLRKETVDVDAIMGAIGGYVLIGLSGSFINGFVSIIYPEAFNIPVIYDSVYNFVYFTFVSYTTLGYGDIIPRIPQSQAISVLLALVGQIYLTILVAILIGKFLFNLGKQEPKQRE